MTDDNHTRLCRANHMIEGEFLEVFISELLLTAQEDFLCNSTGHFSGNGMMGTKQNTV